MLLSVAMIVKNEEKNIEKCLESLQLLKSQMDLEIVVVDTGSTDNTVSIVEKYTENIYFHKWEDNFAEVRNIALGYCSGDWILVVDADEELINPWELCRFFLDELYVGYNSAFVNIKSSNSDEKSDSEYSITPIIRLFRRTQQLRYVGEIHEQPENCDPTCTTSIDFKHKGYYLNDYKLRLKKFRRNSKLLLNRLNEKEDIYTYYQLYSTYLMFNKTEEAIIYLLKAEDLVRKKKNLRQYLYVLLSKANELYKIGEYRRAADQYREILMICPYHIDAIYVLIQCYLQLSDMNNAEIFIDSYLKIIDDKVTFTKIRSLGIESEFFNKKDQLLDIKIKLLYKKEDYKSVIDIFMTDNNIDNKIQWIVLFISACVKIKKYEVLALEVNKLLEYNQELINDIMDVLYKLLLFEELDAKNEILTSISEDNYLLKKYLSILYDNDISRESVNKINFNNYSHIKSQVLKKILDQGYNIFEILENINERDIDRYLVYLCDYYDSIEGLNSYSENALSSNNYSKLNLQKHIDLALISCKKVSNKDKIKIVFRMIINNEYFINNENYKQDEKSEVVHRLYLNIRKMNKDLLGSIRNIKGIAKEQSVHPQILKSLIDFIRDMEDSNIVEKFNNDKDKIINNVIYLIDSGEENNVNEAKKILNELKAILKYDSRIYNLMGIINFIEGNTLAAIVNFNMAIMFNPKDYESIYSLGQCLVELDRKEEAMIHFEYILNNSKEKELVEMCRDVLESIGIN